MVPKRRQEYTMGIQICINAKFKYIQGARPGLNVKLDLHGSLNLKKFVMTRTFCGTKSC